MTCSACTKEYERGRRDQREAIAKEIERRIDEHVAHWRSSFADEARAQSVRVSALDGLLKWLQLGGGT